MEKSLEVISIINSGNIDKFDITYSHSVKSHPSNSVFPLQYHTNEYQVSNSGIAGASNACVLPYYNTSSLPSGTCAGANSFLPKDFAVEGSCRALPCSGRQRSNDGCSSTEEAKDGRMLSKESSYGECICCLVCVPSVQNLVELE